MSRRSSLGLCCGVVLAWVSSVPEAPAGGFNLNPPGSLCLDIRNASEAIAEGVCNSDDQECNGGPSPDGILQCSDTDTDPLNGGMCMDQACYDLGEALYVDVELGPGESPVCGTQLFLEYDAEALEPLFVDADPDDEFGGMVSIFPPMIDFAAGTMDLHVALPVGTACEDHTGGTAGGTVARVVFQTIGECKTFGVRFRPHNPPTAVAGASGSVAVTGCNGEPQPSGVDVITINETPPVWTCPESVTVQAECNGNSAEVFFEPITATDSCEEVPPSSSSCKVLYFLPCEQDADCQGYGACDAGFCTGEVEPEGVDLDALIDGGGTFLAGRTQFFCVATNSCRAEGVCTATIDVLSPEMSTAKCADADADGIRDDHCMWWAGVDCSCLPLETHFGDVGGSYGDCIPDGATDSHDRFHALNCFANQDTQGNFGYPCEDGPPDASNIDVGGPFGDCQPDGVCDANDAIHVMNAFKGESTCSCPLDGGPAPVYAPPGQVAGRASLEVEPLRSTLRPGGTLAVEVRIRGNVPDLRAYQLHLGVDGGRSGNLQLIDVLVDEGPDGVFDGPPSWQAFNVATGQMAAGLDGAGVAVPKGGAHLATFVYRASRDAAGTFVFDVRHEAVDAGGRTFLMPTGPRDRIAIDTATPATVTIRR